MVDPEAAWQFLKRRIFDVEGIELIQRPYSTFKNMVDSLHEAEKLGASCWIVDPLTLIWNELLDSFKQKLGYIPIDKWQDVRQLRCQRARFRCHTQARNSSPQSSNCWHGCSSNPLQSRSHCCR